MIVFLRFFFWKSYLKLWKKSADDNKITQHAKSLKKKQSEGDASLIAMSMSAIPSYVSYMALPLIVYEYSDFSHINTNHAFSVFLWLTHKARPIICSRQQFQILLLLIRHEWYSWESSAGRRFSWNIIPYFFRKLGKMSQNLLSAAVVIGALRVNKHFWPSQKSIWYTGWRKGGPGRPKMMWKKIDRHWLQWVESTPKKGTPGDRYELYYACS